MEVVTKDGVSTTTKYIWGNHGLAAVITDERTVVLLYDDEGEAVGFYVHEEPQPSANFGYHEIALPTQTDYVYTYVKNLQGDVIQIIDEDGEAVVKYTYDPWGVPTVHGDDDLAAINPCSYRGYYYDEETGYYYLQSRYYDPKIGRFINADSQFDENAGFIGNNLYAYCANNPALYKDETGTSITLAIWIGIGIGALIGGLAGWGYAKYFNIPKEKTWKYILGGALIGGIIGGCAGYALSAGSGAVLWSGKGMGEAAAAFAKQNGLKVLEQTLRGKLLSSMAKILPYKIMRPLWEAASARFLLSYAGKQSFVHVFITAEAYANMKSVFNSV